MRKYALPRDIPLSPPQHKMDIGGGAIAVVIPIISGTPTADEIVSLDLLKRHLPAYDKFLLHPDNLEFTFDTQEFIKIPLPRENFRSISSYNHMMMSIWFYEYFEKYDYILIYQTDCLIFGSNIDFWIRKNYSYLGAPYFRRNGKLKGLGNGGFSLRNVRDHIDVLSSNNLSVLRAIILNWRQYIKYTYFRYFLRIICESVASILSKAEAPIAQRFIEKFDRAEDEFWAYYAPIFSRNYTLPPARLAVGFAAESKPDRIVQLNGDKLPLGAHGWTKSQANRTFWETHLATLGPRSKAPENAQD